MTREFYSCSVGQRPTSLFNVHQTGGRLLGSPQALPGGRGPAITPGHPVRTDELLV